jgi:hypothetical protein
MNGTGNVALMNTARDNSISDCSGFGAIDFVEITTATGATNPWANICDPD